MNYMTSVNHELKTPLNAIYGHIQLLSELKMNKNIVSHFSDITGCCEDIMSYMNDIMNLSHVEAQG